jgi:hypothetical protein
LIKRSIFYEVAKLTKPTAEPFMVMRIDVSNRQADGVEGIIQSLHWTHDEADARAKELTKEGTPCRVCAGSGFSGRGTNYDDVCSECGGLRYFP